WIDLEPETARHLFAVSQLIGRAQFHAFRPHRIGIIVAGDEVPHTHIHIVPFDSVAELSFAHADPNPAPGSLDAAAARIREALRSQGDLLGALGADYVTD